MEFASAVTRNKVLTHINWTSKICWAKKARHTKNMLYDFIYMKPGYMHNGGGNDWEGMYGHILGWCKYSFLKHVCQNWIVHLMSI